MIYITPSLNTIDQMTHGQGKQLVDRDRTNHQRNKKNSLLCVKFILLLYMQLLTIGLYAQSELSVYEFIKEHYYSYNADSVAKIQVQDLVDEGVREDRLYYGQSLIAHANYKIGNYKAALNLLHSIPVDRIKYQKLFFDITFLKALIYKNTGRLLKADSIYSETLPQVSEEYPLLLTINYNDFGNVKLFF